VTPDFEEKIRIAQQTNNPDYDKKEVKQFIGRQIFLGLIALKHHK
jgi:hypothetical protein